MNDAIWADYDFINLLNHNVRVYLNNLNYRCGCNRNEWSLIGLWNFNVAFDVLYRRKFKIIVNSMNFISPSVRTRNVIKRVFQYTPLSLRPAIWYFVIATGI